VSGRVVVLSAHLDDAVFSLGATIAATTRSGTEVNVVTVLAGDPESTVPAGWWDRATGFRTLGEAARARRHEDRRACALVGATPSWLPFPDATYDSRPDDDEIWTAVQEAIAGAAAVLVPGFPLTHVDHDWLTMLVLARAESALQIGLYVEQPYAWRAWQRTRAEPTTPTVLQALLDEPARWIRTRRAWVDRRVKLLASRAYASQLGMFGLLPLQRIALHEAIRGERIAWIGGLRGMRQGLADESPLALRT
jgi:LmbE family N-acetylglucosaminyl deacetylase